MLQLGLFFFCRQPLVDGNLARYTPQLGSAAVPFIRDFAADYDPTRVPAITPLSVQRRSNALNPLFIFSHRNVPLSLHELIPKCILPSRYLITETSDIADPVLKQLPHLQASADGGNPVRPRLASSMRISKFRVPLTNSWINPEQMDLLFTFAAARGLVSLKIKRLIRLARMHPAQVRLPSGCTRPFQHPAIASAWILRRVPAGHGWQRPKLALSLLCSWLWVSL